jgi:hypothetical protein
MTTFITTRTIAACAFDAPGALASIALLLRLLRDRLEVVKAHGVTSIVLAGRFSGRV